MKVCRYTSVELNSRTTGGGDSGSPRTGSSGTAWEKEVRTKAEESAAQALNPLRLECCVLTVDAFWTRKAVKATFWCRCCATHPSCALSGHPTSFSLHRGFPNVAPKRQKRFLQDFSSKSGHSERTTPHHLVVLAPSFCHLNDTQSTGRNSVLKYGNVLGLVTPQDRRFRSMLPGLNHEIIASQAKDQERMPLHM
ncbi:hypothetical protein P7K49_035245 [Saguinus oedipus]|uniref:Uncharacterized protein n=1 Tax=Saguinus oedipus TaxID=9490 RepID=A0ABQ9TM32_SAGOE|nr:hypothetical protein P7K49_035245 [Saguinus oedipus]